MMEMILPKIGTRLKTLIFISTKGKCIACQYTVKN